MQHFFVFVFLTLITRSFTIHGVLGLDSNPGLPYSTQPDEKLSSKASMKDLQLWKPPALHGERLLSTHIYFSIFWVTFSFVGPYPDPVPDIKKTSEFGSESDILMRLVHTLQF
jgi:hypothetical protein